MPITQLPANLALRYQKHSQGAGQETHTVEKMLFYIEHTGTQDMRQGDLDNCTVFAVVAFNGLDGFCYYQV